MTKRGKDKPHIEDDLERELREKAKDIFAPSDGNQLLHWAKKYSPVLITLGIGLATYFVLVMYVFYPHLILNGHWSKLLIIITFVFLIAGLFLYLGLRTELLFIRIMSFVFVFIIFTFMLLFILLSHSVAQTLIAA